MPAEPWIIAKGQPLKIIPLIGRIKTGGMMKHLARPDRPISVLPKTHGQGHRIGQVRPPPLAVVVDARADGRRPSSSAVRLGQHTGEAVGVGEIHGACWLVAQG